MKKGIVGFIVLCLLCYTMAPVAVSVASTVFDEKEAKNEPFKTVFGGDFSSANTILDEDPQIEIINHEPGYLYLFSLNPIKMPMSIARNLGYAVVVNRNLKIDTVSDGIHHAKFVAKRVVAGWETVRWDYKNIDGLSQYLDITSTGLYDIAVYAYNEDDNKIGSDSVKIFFIKVGRDDFGIRVHTKYDGGETFTSLLDIGLVEFGSMLSTGESKKFSVTLQNEDDTTVDLSFARTRILGSSEDVVETNFNVETTCDTTKDYEVSVDVKFPFAILDGGQATGSNKPYFKANVGYQVHSEEGIGSDSVDTAFCFGRDSIGDPRVFRMKVKPNSLDSDSKLTFFSSYVTVDDTGNEVFHRAFSVDFEPATELMITSVPREAKISYAFGESTGVPTKLSFRAEGGLLDDIVQSFCVDPLPSYMAFDLTVIGGRELVYESDSSYDVTYSLDSIQNGNLVTFEVVDLPERIHASCGIDLDVFGDLSAYGFVDIDMSDDVERLSLYLLGDEIPFIKLMNSPRKIRVEGFVDIPNGMGNITVFRRLDEVRLLDVSLAFDEIVVTNTFELENSFVQLSWDVDVSEGVGTVEVSRDSGSFVAFSSSIVLGELTVAGAIELRNSLVQLSWDVDRDSRAGDIIALRSSDGGISTISVSIGYSDWVVSDTFDLKNDRVELFWDLPDDVDNHAQLGIVTSGEELFENAVSVVYDSVEIFSLAVGIATDDHFILSWDRESDGRISNFGWSGRILKISGLDVSVNLYGDVFSFNADLNVGETGSFEIGFNKDAVVTFIDTESDMFKVHGDVSLYADRNLNISWALGESGEFTVYTFSESVGDEFYLEFGYDPYHNGNYRHGFRLTGQDFVDITRTIKWYSESGQLQRIWVLGDMPIPGDWELEVLWNYDWYPVPWSL